MARPGAKLMPMAMLGEGEEGVVVSVDGGSGLARRLADMGFTPGARVRVLKNGPPGPLLVEVRGARVALGWGVAMKVLVEPV